MNPRVLFVDHAGVLGGAELYLLDIIRHYKGSSRVLLFEEGPFLDVLYSEKIDAGALKASTSLMGVKKQGNLWDGVRAVSGILRLVRQVAQAARDFDVIYANSQKALVVSALAGRLAGRPVIWNLHDILTSDHFSSTNRRIAVFMANRFVARVIANSKATLEAFHDSGGRVARTGVVYNGIDSSRFSAVDAQEVQRVRRTLGLQDVPVVGVFSRLSPWKGQHILLEALARVPGVHAVLVGDAIFEGDEAYATRLHSMVQKLGLSERVHFLGFRSDVPLLLHMVDIVAHTSTAPEPFGRVIVEGMVVAKPVIATKAGGALEVVQDQETGLLVPPGNVEALACAIRRLIEQPDVALRMASAGRMDALRRFSIGVMLGEIDRHIAKVLHPS